MHQIDSASDMHAPHSTPSLPCCRHRKWDTLAHTVKILGRGQAEGTVMVLLQMVAADAPVTAVKQVMESNSVHWTPAGRAAIDISRQ